MFVLPHGFFSTKHGKAPPGHSASSKPLLATLGVVAACGAGTKRTKVMKVKCRAKMRPEEEDELSLGKERNRWKQTWNTKIKSNTWLYSAIRKDKAGEASRKVWAEAQTVSVCKEFESSRANFLFLVFLFSYRLVVFHSLKPSHPFRYLLPVAGICWPLLLQLWHQWCQGHLHRQLPRPKLLL